MTNKRLPLINMSLHVPIVCLSVSLRKETGCEFPSNSVPNTIGPGGWGGDWYLWHAPDGPRARAATALGCVQAGAEKLGVIEPSYASAIIGVLSPVSSHCYEMLHFGAFYPIRLTNQ